MKIHLLIKLFLIFIAQPSFAEKPSIKQNKKFVLDGKTLIYNDNLPNISEEDFITIDDVKIFKHFFENYNINTLRLSSSGGQDFAGHKIRDLVQKYNINTEAAGECSSACSFIFLAGKKRKLLRNAKLGFHNRYTKVEDQNARIKKVEAFDERLDYENTIAHFTRLNVTNEIVFYQMQGIDMFFILRMLKVHPKDMWYPDIEELKKYGVLN